MSEWFSMRENNVPRWPIDGWCILDSTFPGAAIENALANACAALIPSLGDHAGAGNLHHAKQPMPWAIRRSGSMVSTIFISSTHR
jgi:hypothetical protein